ncbi:hypothetical protein QUA54_05400 [Microcoleus sp. MOSTC5]|uniref:hypothetical protein n=1 Tax=Microcoleus sp. MOSTC5 TaxID=3055378 RepID=UPI002FD5897D
MYFHGIGDVILDDVPEPKIQEPADAIILLTSRAGGFSSQARIACTRSGCKLWRLLAVEISVAGRYSYACK